MRAIAASGYGAIDRVRITGDTMTGELEIVPGNATSNVTGSESLALSAPALASATILVICDDPSNPRVGSPGQMLAIYDHAGNPIFSVPPAGGPKVYGDLMGAWNGVFTMAAQLTPWGVVQVGGASGPQIFGGSGAPPNATMVTWLGNYSIYSAVAKVGDIYIRTDGSGPAAVWQCVVAGTSGSRGGVWAPLASGPLVTRYAPGSPASYSTSSTSLAKVDNANLTVTFVAPPSGQVMVRLTGVVGGNAGGYISWGLLTGGGAQAGSVALAAGQNVPYQTVSIPFQVGSLTPGTSYTLCWAWLVSAGTGLMKADQGSDYGPATMEVSML